MTSFLCAATDGQTVSRAMLLVIIPIIMASGFAAVGYMLRRFITAVDGLANNQQDTNILLATAVQRIAHLEETNQRHHEENLVRLRDRGR